VTSDHQFDKEGSWNLKKKDKKNEKNHFLDKELIVFIKIKKKN